MPIYEYKCSKCGDVFEIIQKFSDASLTVHEKCGGAVERLLSAPGLQFKGSGWYITDYKRSGSSEWKSGESKSGESKSEKSDSKSEGKSDSKPSETKSESKSSEPAKKSD